jgi:isocitrate dehydrogenase kinase/phosphatase
MSSLQNDQLKAVIAAKLARAILAGFDSMLSEFLSITLSAQSRFEQAAWHDVHQAMRDRLKVYEKKVEIASQTAHRVAYHEIDDIQLWHLAKDAYANLVVDHENALIAQTFFNSVFGSIRGHKKIRDVHLFILQKHYIPPRRDTREILNFIDSKSGLIPAFSKLLNSFVFRLPYEDLERDIASIDRVLHKIDPGMLQIEKCHIEFGRSLFFRNKAAYIIGRLIDAETGVSAPFAIALLNNEKGAIYVDAIAVGEEQLSMLLGFARSYFMVDTDQPVRYVDYLCDLLPKKERFELFNAIGFIKHAKTEFYRTTVDATRRMPKEEKYIAAPGIKGMVMLVFTTDSSEYVYKVIKDRVTPPKEASREDVMEKYDYVKNADRVGRLADTHEFRYLAFDLSRFSGELLEEMKQQVGDSIRISGNALILKHVYVERKMTPLNLFVKEAEDTQLQLVMEEYGNAIKQLAAANIFPGDMLMKNFGVTRWGRVIFYDYDEICPLVDCQFRSIPQAEDELDEMSAQPWFDVEENDVFPEQFSVFFAGHRQARHYFEQQHRDIYTVAYWRQVQQQINAGVIADVFPYKHKWRL